MVACPKFVRRTIPWQCNFCSAASGWSLEVSVYAELTVAVVDIVLQQNVNLFMKIIVGQLR